MPATNVLGRDDLSATFERDDGPPITLYGPAAIQFADELAARQAARDAERMAQAAPPPAPAPPEAPPAVLDAPPAPPAMGGGEGTGGGGGGTPTQPAMGTDDAALAAQYAPKPAPPPPPAPAPAALPPGSGMTFGGAAPQPKAEPWPMVHSPGVSRGQLQQKASQGVWTPGTQSIESEGAVPMNPEIEAARATLMQNQLAREVQRHDTEQARLIESESRSWNAAVAMQDEAIAQEKVLQQAREKAAAARARVEQIDQTLAEQRAAPSDFFEKRGGGWAKVAAAIAMGFGQYGATLGGGENGAMKMIFKAIDDEAEAERQNYLRNKDTRGSLLANLNAELGDLDVANEANKALKTRQALAMYERLAIGEKQDDAKLKHAENLDLIKGKYLDHLDGVQRTSLGKTVIRTQGTMKYPVAGGSRPMTEDEIIDRQIKKNERGARLAKSQNELNYQRGESPMGGEHAEKAAERGAKTEKEGRALHVEGYGQAKTEKEAGVARDMMAKKAAMKATVKRLRELAEDPEARNPMSEKGIEARALAKKARVDLAQTFGGILRPEDVAMAGDLLPDPTGIVRGVTKARAAEKAMNEQLDTMANEYVRQAVSGKAVEGAPKPMKVE